MYLSNILVEQKEVVKIEAKYRIEQHGFDLKTSFRKEKKKGRNEFMSAKSILNEQFDACFDQSAWFASAKSALENLSNEDAVWKPNDEIHSVCEIISHLNFYNHKCLQRFNGVKIPKDSVEIAETYSNEDWQNVLNRFNSIMSDWKTLFENTDDAKLEEGDISPMLAHFNIHNAYHIGQIVIVRKLRGNWNAKQGVS